MKKIALVIPRPGMSCNMIQQGYIDTLRHLGWRVYCGDPKTKLGCSQLIERHDIRLIMTSSRYGIRQLPIKVINDRGIAVIVEALPLNKKNLTIDEPYEFAHDDEPDLVKEIQRAIVHTRMETSLWSKYMCGWCDNDVMPMLLPAAGNMVKALPPTCSILTDVAMVANFSHRQDIMKYLIEPLFKRLDLLGYSYQAFGDQIWHLAGLNHNGILGGDSSRLAHIYATAKVCPNVHTTRQVTLQACVNERSFMIPLCGGIQVSDNPLISKYLGAHCKVATSTTDFMNKVIGLVEDQSRRFDIIRGGAEEVANSHTYFNRLEDLFRVLGLSEFADETKTKGQRLAVRHLWELEGMLSADERGVSYEQNVV
jgi:hypothetical protein